MTAPAGPNPNDVSDSPLFTRTTIKIPSILPNWNLHAWYYQPKRGRAPYPVIVMAHGLGSNKLMGLAAYAQAFSAAGYACVVFDYRRWGGSDGSPRHCLYITEQLDDYRTVVKYCRQQPELDPHRVIIWGTSLSGGHVTLLATEKKLNLSAAVVQCPWLGVGQSPSLTSLPVLKLFAYSCLDVLKQAVGLGPLYIPTVSEPGQVAVLTTPDSPMLIKLAYESVDFPNEISASSVFELQMHRPVEYATNAACPILIVNADQDSICLLQGALDYARACPSAELVHIDCGHFEIYPGQPCHKQTLDAQLEFVKRIVPV